MAGQIGLISKYSKYEGVWLSIYHWLIKMWFLGAQSCLQEESPFEKGKIFRIGVANLHPAHPHSHGVSPTLTWIETFECRAHRWGEKGYAAVSHKATQQEVIGNNTIWLKRFVTSYPLRSLLSKIIGPIYQDYSNWGENTMLQLERLNHWC